MNRILKIIIYISFELLFVLYLMAGMYKADPRFAFFENFIKIDITVFFLLLSVYIGGIIFLINLLKKKNISRYSLTYVCLYLTFSAFVLFSLFYTPGVKYATDKAFRILILTGWASIGSTIIISDREGIQRFFIIFILLGILISIDCINNYFTMITVMGYLARVGGAGAGYLGTGQVAGISFLLLLIQMLGIRNVSYKILSFPFLVILLTALLVSGGRGPVFATLIGFITLIFLSFRLRCSKIYLQKRYKFLSFILMILIILIIVLARMGYFEILERRTSLLLSQEGEESAQVRFEHYRRALIIWSMHPLVGAGIGSFPVLIGLGDIRGYPHNLIIESLCELGIVGLILLALLIIYPLYLISKVHYRDDPLGLSILIVFIIMLVNSMFSGDINDNRLLFTFAGFLVSYSSLKGIKRGNKDA